MTINVVHGGFVRMSFVVNSGSSDIQKGEVVELLASGEVRRFDSSSTTSVKGLALDAYQGTASTSADSLKRAPSGNRVTVLLDEAVVETDQITSGVTFSPNEAVYPTDSAGEVTDQTTVSHVIGKALTQTPWTNTLTWFFSVQY
jgi:hypothetical protein